MKREELEKLGLSKEQIDAVCDLHEADMKPLRTELQTAKDDLAAAKDKVKTTEEALKKFDGVDPEALNKQMNRSMDGIQALKDTINSSCKEKQEVDLSTTEKKISQLSAQAAGQSREINDTKQRVNAIEADEVIVHGKIAAQEAEVSSLKAKNAEIEGKLTAQDLEIKGKATIKQLDAVSG